ncbi:MAG TPA: hypothetical protein DDW52_25885, partial [Planctomycetaceae bacterium]|nr:hypothetical protein [Planctomycetaceae bacterium]
TEFLVYSTAVEPKTEPENPLFWEARPHQKTESESELGLQYRNQAITTTRVAPVCQTPWPLMVLSY